MPTPVDEIPGDFLSFLRFRSLQISFLQTSLKKANNLFLFQIFLFFALFLDLTKLNLKITSHFIQVKVSYPILFTIPMAQHINISIMLPLYNTKFDAFREIIISLATSGGRREIELNSRSLPPIPGGLATLRRANQRS